MTDDGRGGARTARVDRVAGLRAHPPAVSVIVPTYQRRELVRRAVASVFAQTLTDWELIVVDDGSTDGTREALAAVRDPRLQYHWQPNRGVSAARNRALSRAQAPIVAFLDSDDLWLPDHLATISEMLARHPRAVLATTGASDLLAGRQALRRAVLRDVLPAQLIGNVVGWPSTVAARRHLVAALGGFDEAMAVHEDVDLFTRLALHGPAAVLRRRTVVKHYTRGLRDWGIRHGLYAAAHELKARHAAAELAHLPDARAASLAAPAEGAIQFALALQALDRDDEREFAAALGRACLALPALSHEPAEVQGRLLRLTERVDQRLRHLSTAAEMWPERGCDTALYLRWCALLTALGSGRLRAASGLMAGWPLSPTLSFLGRALPLLSEQARRALDRRRYRSRRSVERRWAALSRGRKAGATPARWSGHADLDIATLARRPPHVPPSDA